MQYVLGKHSENVKVETAGDYKQAVLSMLEQARHNIDIFTQDLESETYNNHCVEQAIILLAKRHPKTRVRILVQDSTKAMQNGHCLIRLAQHLTSSVFIHTPALTHKGEQSAFMVVDNTGLIHRPQATDRDYHATINFNSPRSAASQLELFNDVWEHSSPDIETRRIYV